MRATWLALLLLATATATQAEEPQPRISCEGNEKNLATYLQIHDVLFTQRDSSRVAEFYAPEVISHNLDTGGSQGASRVKHAQMAAMWTASKALVPERKRALLVVDEAQNLTARAVEELRMLSNFQLDNRSLLQSFLVGQPELRQVLHSGQLQQLRQRVIASYHLGPMDRTETRAYIEHRLKHVGWKGDPAIDADAFEAIFAHSGGIPRRVNLICNRVMLAGYLGEKHQLGVADVRAVANEIQKELGPETVTNPNAPARPAAANLPVPIGQGQAAQTDLAKLEDRVSRLERLVHSTVSLLHTLIERENQARSVRKG
jgi:hypothetical protein